MAVFLLKFPHIFVRVLHIVVADIFKYFLQVAYGLVCYLDQILNVIVLMLFEGMEEHIHYGILIVTCLLAFRFFTLPILDLKHAIL